jgi:hypothetical protein
VTFNWNDKDVEGKCDDMEKVFLVIYWIDQGFKYSTVIVNFLLRLIVITLVQKMGYKSNSGETKNIMVLVFLIQFFNTGPFLVLINSDLSSVNIPLIRYINAGIYTDFNPKWYQNVGEAITITMITTIAWPVVEFLIFWMIRLAKRYWDQRWRYSVKTR